MLTKILHGIILGATSTGRAIT